MVLTAESVLELSHFRSWFYLYYQSVWVSLMFFIFVAGGVTLTVQLKTLVQSTTGMREVLKQATKYKHHKDNEVGCGPLIPNYIFAEQNEQTFIHAIKEACNPTPARS